MGFLPAGHLFNVALGDFFLQFSQEFCLSSITPSLFWSDSSLPCCLQVTRGPEFESLPVNPEPLLDQDRDDDISPCLNCSIVQCDKVGGPLCKYHQP